MGREEWDGQVAMGRPDRDEGRGVRETTGEKVFRDSYKVILSESQRASKVRLAEIWRQILKSAGRSSGFLMALRTYLSKGE